MAVYWPRFSTLQLLKDKGTDYGISWKSKRLCGSTLFPQYTHFFHSIKCFGHLIGIKLIYGSFSCRTKKYAAKIINAYIVYELDTWPKNPLENFTLKNFQFGATSILKSSNKSK